MTAPEADEANVGEKRTHKPSKLSKNSKWKRRRLAQTLYTGESVGALEDLTAIDDEQICTYNLLNFKIAELISEAAYSKAQRLDVLSCFDELKKIILKCQHIAYSELSVSVPSPDHAEKDKILEGCKYQKPLDVSLCGSFVDGTALNNVKEVDVRVVLPKTFFCEKDYLNQRYIVRKAYYAAVLANHLKSYDKYNIVYICPNDNPLDIGLEVALPDVVKFTIHLNVEKNTFVTKRLHPHTCNVRPKHVLLNSNFSDDDLPATPLYNSTLSANMNFDCCEKLIHDWSLKGDVIKQCMILTKIWMHQRQLDRGFSCLTPFILKMFMVYLLKNDRLPFHLASSQMFTSFLQKIASHDWTKPITLCGSTTEEELVSHKKYSELVFLDPSGTTNICASVSKQSVDQLCHHAQETATYMLKDPDSSFDGTFIKRLPHYMYYDLAIRIENFSQLDAFDEGRYVDSCGDKIHSSLTRVVEVLKLGMGSRIVSLCVSPMRRKQVPVSKETFPSKLVNNRIAVHLHIDTDHAYSILERGPPADDATAEDFRHFWGDKSNLRRFMDGAICEAVVWQAETANQRRLVIDQIIKFILERHCGIKPSFVTTTAGMLDDLLKKDNFNRVRNVGTGEEELSTFQASFFKLSKQIKGIESLPIKISDVLGLDPIFRQTEVFPPQGSDGLEYIPYTPSKALAIIEGAKWPSEPDAVSSLKALILLKLRDELTLLDSVKALIRQDCLTVVQDGYMFDVYLMNAKELDMLRRDHSSEQSLQLYKDFVVAPQLTSAINGIQSQFVNFGPSARLFKRWAGLNMLSSFLTEPITDLLSAATFVSPTPFQVPRCPMVSLYRALHILVYHDWANEPLIVNFNEEINADTVDEIKEDFRSRRSEYPCASFVTLADKESNVSKQVAPFMMKLVRDCASSCLQKLDRVMTSMDWSSKQLKDVLCEANYDMLDVLIELKSDRSRREPAVLEQSGKSVKVHVDPIHAFIDHLQKSYSEKAVIMYDATNIKYIGLVWKPGCFDAENIEVGSMKLSRVLHEINEELFVKLSLDAIIHDINYTGKGLIEKITINTM